MARLTPATCHSFTSRYSLSASAARKDRLRPVLLAGFSSRFLTSGSTRTVKVVEGMGPSLVSGCVHYSTRWHVCNFEQVSLAAIAGDLSGKLVVRADVEIPERHISMAWSLRYNTDPHLPASHTIELLFNLPADIPGGGIAEAARFCLRLRRKIV